MGPAVKVTFPNSEQGRPRGGGFGSFSGIALGTGIFVGIAVGIGFDVVAVGTGVGVVVAVGAVGSVGAKVGSGFGAGTWGVTGVVGDEMGAAR